MSTPRTHDAPPHARALGALLCGLLLALPFSARAEEGPDAGAPAPEEGGEMNLSLDEVEPPPAPRVDLPPMPKDGEDFSADHRTFQEVTTAPEDFFKAQRAAADKLVGADEPLYRRNPPLAWGSQAGAALFAAGALGLMGGAVGDAIDEGDPRKSLGGLHGPVFGGALGTLAGTSLAVWGTSRLVDHETHPGWIVGGAVIGSVVGSAAAFGIAEGSDRGDGASGLAVGTFLIAQIGAAVLFTELFEKPPKKREAKPTNTPPPQSAP